MCGISGFFGNEIISNDNIKTTLNSMKNRGPNSQNHIKFTLGDINLYLLHSRLSILDLDKRSNQPFIYKNYCMIYNGEIYNYLEIKKELIKLGYSFKTTSDTEVIIKAYDYYGENCFSKFEGMWAICIWDDDSKKLLLVRDRFNEKPLYYFQSNKGLYFGSEIKFIKNLYSKNIYINPEKINSYLSYGYKSVKKNNITFFEGIKSLNGSEIITVNPNLKIKKENYYKIPLINKTNINISEAIQTSKELLVESVKKRLRADVPIAFCLSGGIDSGSLSSIAVKVLKKEITTFSILDSDKRYNEESNIDKILMDLKCKNHKIKIKKKIGFKNLVQLIKYHDSPISTISYLVHSLLSKSISEKGFKVAISGTGADEIYTGYYDHFLQHLAILKNKKQFNNNLLYWEKNIKTKIRNKLLKNPYLYIENKNVRSHLYDYISNIELIKNKNLKNIKEKLLSKNLMKNRMLNELFYEIVPVILHEDDLNSMMYSIENRSPFLDTNLIEYMYSLPRKILIKNGYSKYILRESMKNIVNDEIRLDRKKVGFNAGIESVFDFNNKTEEYLFEKNSSIFDYIDRDIFISKFKNKYFFKNDSKFLFNFINMKIFLNEYI